MSQAEDRTLAAGAPVERPVRHGAGAMKDHEKRELVNRLTALALEFADTQQLRARIAGEVLPAITAAEAAERERCAKLCDGYAKRGGLTTAEEVTAKTLADILRA